MSVNVQFIQNFHTKIVQVSCRIFSVNFPPASRQESPDAARRRECPPNGSRSLARYQHRASLRRAVASPSAFRIFPNFFRKIPRQHGQPSGPCARPRFPRRSAASFPPPASPASPAQVSASVTASAASAAILRKFSGQHRRHKARQPRPRCAQPPAMQAQASAAQARQRARDPATISASASAPICAPDFPGQHPAKVSSRASAQIFRRIFQRAANFPAQISRTKKRRLVAVAPCCYSPSQQAIRNLMSASVARLL